MIRNSLLACVCLSVLGTPLVAAAECYGPVGRGDTLWQIALRLRPDPSITPQRMMLALLEANPGAFGHVNVNALNAESILCLGQGDYVKTDELAAITEVRRHNREWKSRRAPVDAGSHQRGATPERPPAARPERDREQPNTGHVDHRIAASGSRLAHIEDRIEHLESKFRTAGPGRIQIAEELAQLTKRVARIERWIKVLAASLETQRKAERTVHNAMEPMPTPAPQNHTAMEPMPALAPHSDTAMEPMPTPAPQSDTAMEPMPTPAPQNHGAMEPMPTPAPQSNRAMEPMPTPAPQNHEAMEPTPTPAPQSYDAMKPMPTPEAQNHEAMEPMPTPAPQNQDAVGWMPTPAPQNREAAGPEPEAVTEKSVSAHVATWFQRVKNFLKQ